jgi:hypothetical protein
VGNPIDVKLKQVADELHNVVVSYLQVGNTYIPCASYKTHSSLILTISDYSLEGVSFLIS